MSLNVSRWQAARRQYPYTEVMQFFLRMIISAELDARRMRPNGTPSDEALLARNWFATETKPGKSDPDYFTSFSHCCHVLDRDENASRLMSLRIVDGYDLQPCAIGPLHWATDSVTVRRWRQVQDDEESKPRWESFLQPCEWVRRENAPDFDTEECDIRLEYLLANPLPDDDPEPVFEGYRVVPALDQGCLFAA